MLLSKNCLHIAIPHAFGYEPPQASSYCAQLHLIVHFKNNAPYSCLLKAPWILAEGKEFAYRRSCGRQRKNLMSESNPERNPILVTRSSLPDLDSYLYCIRDIYETRNFTNQGKYVYRLETELKRYLDLPWLACCANGTLALQMALRLFNLQGKKIITTPFTYVATLTSILWEGCEAVLADIDPRTLCIDPQKVEDKLKEDPEIAGIMPVHVYGNACDVSAFDFLAEKYEVKIIYDGAHAFGSSLNGSSLLAYGDAATCSFHATKLFHTIEGGLIAARNQEEIRRLKLLHAFGHRADDYEIVGINAKLSEPHAAMGVCLLPLMPAILQKRAQLVALYNAALEIDGNPDFRLPALAPGLTWNHAYYPLVFKSNALMTKALKELNTANIHPRRYFFPSLSTLPYVQDQPCPISEDISERVLCLPLWGDMNPDLPPMIAGIVKQAFSS